MWHEERLLIDGELVDASDGGTFETVNPATGETLGVAADATVADAERAMAAARRAFDETDWATDVDFRLRCVRQLHEALLRHRDDLAALVVAETGVPVMMTAGPALDAPIEVVGWHADLLEKYDFTEDLGDVESRGRLHHRWVEREAVGVAAAIVPYNYPVQISLAKLAPALAAGCTVILKGPPEAPWTTAALGKLVAEETDIPAGVVNVLFGARAEIGAVLTTDPRVDLVSFTGSTATGRRIMAAAAPTVKKLFLELGGKSALVVLDDAPLDLAAMLAAFTITSHAGQGCAITSRLLVPRAIFGDVVDQVKAVLVGIAGGDPTQPATMMGPLVSREQRDKVHGMVTDAVANGATVVTGGTLSEGAGWFYEPTLLVDVDNADPIAQHEVFGPVLVAIPYDGDDDAIAMANDSIFGLSGSVLGTDPERCRSVARRMRTGTVSINGGSWYAPDAPFGGYKQSGIGREMGVVGFEEYLEAKTIAEPAPA